MKVFACCEHIDEGIDYIVNETKKAPLIEYLKTEQKCFLCGLKAEYKIYDEKINRCDWCEKAENYIKYHDEEWGVPCYDDKKQFEFLVLESAQAGLSWLTILNKRENYKLAYDNFNVKVVSNYDKDKIEELMNNSGIIRNRRKIEASVNNAKCFIKIQEEFESFSKYIWSFVNNRPVINCFEKIEELPAKTDISERLSKDMKKRGFKFLGPVIVYSHMQAMGLVNDHLISCPRYKECMEYIEEM